MRRWTTRFHVPLVFAGLLSLSACAVRYPMGLSREQWESLPPSQQAEYQAKQYQIDADNRARAEEARRQEVAQKADRERLELERLRQAYANARYGDIVTVTVQGGTLSYAGKRYSYEPVSFDLVFASVFHIDNASDILGNCSLHSRTVRV